MKRKNDELLQRDTADADASCSTSEGRQGGKMAKLEISSDLKLKGFETRSYQIELVEIALRENVIICLPTGSGKTFIALQVIQRTIGSNHGTNRKVMFLANTKPLVHQQADFLQDFLTDGIKVVALTGDSNVDAWNAGAWQSIMSKADVIVMTTKILENAERHGFISWDRISLLVLDECHHSSGNDSLTELMDSYKRNKLSGRMVPRVLGLTATVVNGCTNEAKLESEINRIQSTLCSRAITYHDWEEVLRNSTSANVHWIPYNSIYKSTDLCCESLQKFKTLAMDIKISSDQRPNEGQLYGNSDLSSDLKKMAEDVLQVFEELGPYCAKIAAGVKRLQIQKILADGNFPRSSTSRKLIESLDSELMSFSVTMDVVMSAQYEIEQREIPKKEYFVRNMITPKVFKLLSILDSHRNLGATNPEEVSLCAIIFCQRRLTAVVLNHFLTDLIENCKEYDFLKADFVVGTNNGGRVQNVDEMRKAARRQASTIAKFREKVLNVIIATSVLEEGIDIPFCNVVIRFNGCENYPSYVQSMGRARKEGAQFFVFVPAANEKGCLKKLESFKQCSIILAKLLSKKVDCVGEDFGMDYESAPEIEDFCPYGPDGPRVNQIGVISLVYTYCQKLSSDSLGSCDPVAWHVTQEDGTVKAYLVLPNKSPVRGEIEGPPMKNKILAKRAVFMKAYQQLHACGELDENLLPRDRLAIPFECNFLKELEAVKLKDETELPGKVGSRKRARWYLKQVGNFPLETIGGPIIEGCVTRIYAVTLKFSAFEGSNFSSYAFQFEKHPYKLGLITNCAMLKEIPDFFLKTNKGHVIVSLVEVRGGVCFNTNSLRTLQAFQRFMSEQAYSIPVYTIFSPETVSKLLIAPLTQDGKIDWMLIEKLLAYDKVALSEELSPQEQEAFAFKKENYLDAMVVPWCDISRKTDELDVYFVEEVVNGSSAYSCFPNSKDTLKMHAERVLKKSVKHPQNPYLRCYKIGRERNFLFSVNTNKKDSASCEVATNAKKKWNRYFLPEFVHLSPIPASILLQGKFIPSVIHRIHRLLAGWAIKDSVGRHMEWNVDEDKHEFVRKFMLSSQLKTSRADGTSQPQGAIASTSKSVSRAQSNGVSVKHEILEIDYQFLHPKHLFEVMGKTSEKLQNKQKLRANANKFHVPDPIEEEDVTKGLIDAASFSFPSFDTPIDFKKEKGPSSYDIMEALTLLGANDCFNMEKLEVMGDSTLKLIVSDHLYSHFPQWDEGKLTYYRTQFISNEHLYLIGSKRNLGKLLSSCKFNPDSSFLPPGFEISTELQSLVLQYDTDYEDLKTLGRAELSSQPFLKNLLEQPRVGARASSSTTYTHTKINDKSIADAVEALIGAYYLNGGLESAFRIMYWMSMEGPLQDGNSAPYCKDLNLTVSNDLVPAPNNNEWETPYNFLPGLDTLERVLDYKFNNKWLAVEALTHSSYYKNRITGSYERLEFIGDAVLDFLITDYIIKRAGIRDPGQITDLRSALVNNVTFGILSTRYRFHKHLLYTSEKLHEMMTSFNDRRRNDGFLIEDMFTILSDEECEMAEDVEMPKVLGDIFESIMGAIYIDSKFSLDAVWRRAYRLMKKEIDAFSMNVPIAPVRKLNEKYATLVQTIELPNLGPYSNRKVVEVSIKGKGIKVRGMGSTKKLAKEAAAKYILKKFP